MNIVIQICLPNGELETTDAENAFVFVAHFHSVFINHRPMEWTVLKNIKQIEVMDELDQPISWYEMKKSTTKLSKDKAPGLNGVPSNAFHSLDDSNISLLMIFYNQFWHS